MFTNDHCHSQYLMEGYSAHPKSRIVIYFYKKEKQKSEHLWQFNMTF